LERKRIAEQTKGIGRPKVGGPFDLIDHNGNPFTDKDLKGKYSLVCLFYFELFCKHGLLEAVESKDCTSLANCIGNVRCTLASRIAQIFVLTNWIKWPT
jgi:hypothetical protein